MVGRGAEVGEGDVGPGHRHHPAVSRPPRSLVLLLAALTLVGGGAHGAEPEPPARIEAATGPAPAADSPPVPAPDEEEDDPAPYQGWATPQEPDPAPPPRREPITLLFAFGAYYTSAGLYLPLTSSPTPDAGEQGEAQIYWSLLRGALAPRFLVLEASVNPMPILGLGAHQWSWGYQRAQLTPDFNLVRALTAGFDEPFALSVFIGNVADFAPRGRSEVRGRGYLGVVVSGGVGHIRENVLVDDRWLETELKLKGDRVGEEQKLSWSFRVGLKLHDNPDIADTAYLGLRRSRVDYQEGSPWLANSGIEYRFDLSLQGRPLRHFLLVDKKWPLGKGRAALVLGAGLLWESGAAYRGALAERHGTGLQLLLRPNIVF
jgi:hypothetical protein